MDAENQKHRVLIEEREGERRGRIMWYWGGFYREMKRRKGCKINVKFVWEINRGNGH
jgi:hypothetical protein